ncbi:cobalamin biosynthesis protein [Phaeovulum vinaykumarii]|uniref:Cobalt-precorrin 5A hydrolase n=1 Tax=Phaeovulum vinaykumarii TaxID=407234 RepID=A0A1N7KCW3_9RHOB|nr:cobalamin biosynthesis protein [Phaeovulum vinaykumarii]SIS59320.1 cobalt-precorrin 5A hydrolase [Phaeovulum vinaykumarii]SOB94082.1 cobalt-precorrin 5A hydrolase [Phaeovulum vinaykumarii]
MKVAGIGFRAGTPAEAVRAALGGLEGVDALVTLEARAAALTAMRLGPPVRALPEAAIRGIETPTQSPRLLSRFGTGSVAEALALAALGPGARLLGPRRVSPCGRATAALALHEETP